MTVYNKRITPGYIDQNYNIIDVTILVEHTPLY